MKVTKVEVEVDSKIYSIENSGKSTIEFVRRWKTNDMPTKSFSSYGDPDKIARIIHSSIYGKPIVPFDMDYMLLLSIVSMLMDG